MGERESGMWLRSVRVLRLTLSVSSQSAPAELKMFDTDSDRRQANKENECYSGWDGGWGREGV